MNNSSATEPEATPITTEALEADGWQATRYDESGVFYDKGTNNGFNMYVDLSEGIPVSLRYYGESDAPLPRIKTMGALKQFYDLLCGESATGTKPKQGRGKR